MTMFLIYISKYHIYTMWMYVSHWLTLREIIKTLRLVNIHWHFIMVYGKTMILIWNFNHYFPWLTMDHEIQCSHEILTNITYDINDIGLWSTIGGYESPGYPLANSHITVGNHHLYWETMVNHGENQQNLVDNWWIMVDNTFFHHHHQQLLTMSNHGPWDSIFKVTSINQYEPWY